LVFLDPSRVALETDPTARQAHVALGAFLESCALAAPATGFSTQVVLFPNGINRIDDLGRSPVARLILGTEPDEVDTLVGYLDRRHTNRRRYRGPVSDDDVAALVDSVPPATVTLVRDSGTLRRLSVVLIEAMRVDTNTGLTHAEKVTMIRPSDEDAAEAGDGMTYENLGYTGRTRTLVESMYPLRGSHGRWFRYGTIFIARRVARSAPAIGVLESHGNTRVDQVEAGRALLRLWLTATSRGLVIHPMCQVLQEVPDQAGPQASFRRVLEWISPGTELPSATKVADVPTAQVVFRLGRAVPTPPSPRRPLADVLVS
jgi:hypothetical protein